MSLVPLERLDALSVETLDHVTTITLNRPERLNALDVPARAELLEVLRSIDGHDETRVVVLTGAGRAFCAGGDISRMAEEHADHQTRAVHSLGRHLVAAMLLVEKPIIARVNGPAMGLGATLALSCDMVVMADEAVIADTHVPVGLTAGDGGSILWPLMLGPSRAKELLMTGRRLTGVEAARLGLVNASHPQDELDGAVQALAERLRDLPAYAVRSTKASVNRAVDMMTHNGLDSSLAWEHLSMNDHEHHAALERFAASRNPGR